MMRTFLISMVLLSFYSSTASGQQAAQAPKQPPAQETPAEPSFDPDALFATGKELFETYASDEVKAEYDFPDKAQWDAFFQSLQTTLDGSSIEALASREPEVRQALAGLQTVPGFSDYTTWLDERLDLIQAAQSAKGQVMLTPTRVPNTDTAPSNPSTGTSKPSVPYFDVWMARMKDRPKPSGADALIPKLKEIFAAEGIPESLVWLAEVESTLNPEARSPAGAKGLFQLMPVTAKSLGLSTFPFDERAHPEKSAKAAAKMLHDLHRRFGSWPLALAAYNAGQTRVGNVLKTKKSGADFSDIAPHLPSETRMYVPKVLATVAVREGVDLTQAAAGPRVAVAL